MTRRRDIENHCRKLGEIKDIMSSMKTLAYLETHKLSKLIEAQHVLDNDYEQAAADLLKHYPDVLPTISSAEYQLLIIGSQRGFCGNYNEKLAAHFHQTLAEQQINMTHVIIVGQKANTLLSDLPCEVSYIEGANVSEEIPTVVDKIVNTLTSSDKSVTSLYTLYHSVVHESVVAERILPPFLKIQTAAAEFPTPPVLNMSPDELVIDLVGNYLFMAFHRVLYDSLISENQLRVQHLENAVNHLDKKTEELLKVANSLRQEEIIEEIEVILLNSPAM